MAKKIRLIQVIAFLALFWIIIWILWTWILVLFWAKEVNNQETLSPQQYEELQKMIESQSWNTTINNSWGIEINSNMTWSIELWTWEIEK